MFICTGGHCLVCHKDHEGPTHDTCHHGEPTSCTKECSTKYTRIPVMLNEQKTDFTYKNQADRIVSDFVQEGNLDTLASDIAEALENASEGHSEPNNDMSTADQDIRDHYNIEGDQNGTKEDNSK